MNKDLDGDGDIGVDNPIAPTIEQSSVVAQVTPVQEVIAYDAESDPTKYNLLQTPV